MLKIYRCVYMQNYPLKNYISTFSWKQDYIKTFAKLIKSKVEFINIHGPSSDELITDLNMENKLCLITGANSGIGLELTRCLSACDCDVLMACRNTYNACCAAKRVCEKDHRLKYYELNLASLRSVQQFSEKVIGLERNIDIVILNAATFGLPWTLTEDKLETTFQINFLSQYYLLLCIEKVLAPDARVIFTSSESHRYVSWPDDMLVPSLHQVSLPRHGYTSIRAYNVSKLCGVLAMHYFRYRWSSTAKSVLCTHPGSFVKTGLCRNWWAYEMLYTIMLPFSKSITQAASTILYCATSPDLRGHTGLYFKGFKPVGESVLARDTYFSFRLHDLVCDVLRERQIDCSNIRNYANREAQDGDTVGESLVSNY